MKKKGKANTYYMGSCLLGVAVLLCASGIEHSVNGWVMLAWTGAGVVLGGIAVAMAGLGLAAEQEDEVRKVHKKPKDTVTAGRNGRKAG